MSRVGLIGSNSVEFIDKLLSIWNNNDSAVLIDYDTPAKAAADMLSEVGADFCYVEDICCFTSIVAHVMMKYSVV